MSKIKNWIEDQRVEEERRMAEDLEMLVKEHDAGLHKGPYISWCEKCGEPEKYPLPDDFFATAGKDALRARDDRTGAEIYEDNRNNPLE